jgi:hypothetical protein
VMANQSITLVASATVNGRLLAQVGSVTMDTNQVSLLISAELTVWAPNTFFSVGQVIFDCASNTYQWVTTPGVSGATRPTFNVGVGVTTTEGPSLPPLTWTDPPTPLLVLGPTPPTPPNTAPPAPLPPTGVRIDSEA